MKIETGVIRFYLDVLIDYHRNYPYYPLVHSSSSYSRWVDYPLTT